MEQKSWNEISRIFHAALELDPSQRRSFVAVESNGDFDLSSQVEALLRADEEAGSYFDPCANLLGRPFSEATPLAPGDILCKRFRIVREIAEGGMGHVFEAFDSELSLPVAIKVIRSEIAANSDAIARFRQEVRLARKVTHPNVCRTFDIERDIRFIEGQRVELIFLKMEFLQGETLAARIKRDGPISISEALIIARQIAGALSAAHALGIIHRDVKPANIMLVPSESLGQKITQAVVMDFGLARLNSLSPLDGRSGFSNTGRAIGTLAYMAPEQIEGSSISTATDVYAFGLILFEMVTGQRAFSATYTMSGFGKRLRGSLPLDLLKTPLITTDWRDAIEDCLCIRPSDRPSSPATVIARLEQNRGEIFGRFNLFGSRRKRFTSKALAITSLFLAATALFLFGLRLYQSSSDSKVDPGALVYLTQVRNQTEDKSFDNLTEMIRAGLSQSTQINVLDRGRVGDILQQMTKSPESIIDVSTAREIAMRTGASRVIFATVSGSKNIYRIDIDLQQPDDTPTRYRRHWTNSFVWKKTSFLSDNSAYIPADLSASVRDASDWIRSEVGESANDIARLDAPPADVTTGDWAALQDFSSAQRLLAIHNKDAAIRLLQSATEKDPHFAIAYATLADNLQSEFRADEARAAYSKAVAFEQEGRLTSRERYFIVATHANDTKDFQVALDALKSYTDLYPNDYQGWFYLSYPLIALGRADDALFALHKAAALHPGGGGALLASAVSEIAAGRLESARAYAEQSRAAGSDQTPVVFGVLDFLADKYANAEQNFRQFQSAPSSVSQAMGYALLASLKAEIGQTANAIDALDQGVDHARNAGDKVSVTARLLDKAYLLCRHGRYVECFATLDLQEAAATDPSGMIIMSFVLGTAAQSGPPGVRAESASRLRSLADLASRQSDDMIARIARFRINGEFQAASGKWAASLQAFRNADRLDAPIADRAYLGRALASAAEYDPNPVKSKLLRTQAAEAFRHTLASPGRLWQKPWLYPPGLLADEMQAYLHLCAIDPKQDDFCAAETNRYRSLRAKQP